MVINNQKLFKIRKKIIIVIAFFIVIIFLLFFLGVCNKSNLFKLSSDAEDWSNFGSYLGGTLSSIASTIMLYLLLIERFENKYEKRTTLKINKEKEIQSNYYKVIYTLIKKNNQLNTDIKLLKDFLYEINKIFHFEQIQKLIDSCIANTDFEYPEIKIRNAIINKISHIDATLLLMYINEDNIYIQNNITESLTIQECMLIDKMLLKEKINGAKSVIKTYNLLFSDNIKINDSYNLLEKSKDKMFLAFKANYNDMDLKKKLICDKTIRWFESLFYFYYIITTDEEFLNYYLYKIDKINSTRYTLLEEDIKVEVDKPVQIKKMNKKKALISNEKFETFSLENKR